LNKYLITPILFVFILIPSISFTDYSTAKMIYRIEYFDGRIEYIEADLYEGVLTINNVSIPLIFNTTWRNYESTQLKILINDSLETYEALHIIFNRNSRIYELYYDKNTKILLYGIVSDGTSGEELFELTLTTKPSNITNIITHPYKQTGSITTNNSNTNSPPRSPPLTNHTDKNREDFSPYIFLLSMIITIIVILLLIKKIKRG